LKDGILSCVLNLILCWCYDEAQHLWIEHSKAEQAGKPTLVRKADVTSNDGTVIQK